MSREALPSFDEKDRLSPVFGDRPGTGKLLVHTNDVSPVLAGAVVSRAVESANQ